MEMNYVWRHTGTGLRETVIVFHCEHRGIPSQRPLDCSVWQILLHQENGGSADEEGEVGDAGGGGGGVF